MAGPGVGSAEGPGGVGGGGEAMGRCGGAVPCALLPQGLCSEGGGAARVSCVGPAVVAGLSPLPCLPPTVLPSGSRLFCGPSQHRDRAGSHVPARGTPGPQQGGLSPPRRCRPSPRPAPPLLLLTPLAEGTRRGPPQTEQIPSVFSAFLLLAACCASSFLLRPTQRRALLPQPEGQQMLFTWHKSSSPNNAPGLTKTSKQRGGREGSRSHQHLPL